MQKIGTCLWFDTQAEEAARFYVSLFPNSAVGLIMYNGPSSAEVSGFPEGSVQSVEFTLNGQEYTAINGGDVFQLTPAISLMANCDNQEEVDRLWNTLCEGGEPLECGWVTDKYGVTWQVIPTELNRLLNDTDPVKVERVMAAMISMKKLDIAMLLDAYHGK